MWTHAQLAWWWYLELRRDRNVICIMRYKPNLVLGWVVVELTAVPFSPLKKTFESTWVLVPLRKEEDSLLSLVWCKKLLSLSTMLLVGLLSLSCIPSSPWKMVLSLLTAVGWWWAKSCLLVLESEELDKHIMVIQRSSSMDWTDISSTTSHPRTRLGSYLIIQMTFLSLLNFRYHHHANWTWVHMSLSSCCS